MAAPEEDTTKYGRTTYTRESNSTGWFVGIIVLLALIAIGYLVFSANSGPGTPVAEKAPVAFYNPMGSVVVGTEAAALILKASDGTCSAMERTDPDQMWYAQSVECPAAEPTPTPAVTTD